MSVPGLTPHAVPLTLESGSGTTFAVDGYDGQFEIPDLEQGGFEVIDVRNRGQHVALLRGADRTYDVSFNFTVTSVTDMTNGSCARVADFFRKPGLYASDTSLESIGCDVWAFKATLSIADACGKSVVITLPKCRGRVTTTMDEEHLKLSGNVTCYTLPTIA